MAAAIATIPRTVWHGISMTERKSKQKREEYNEAAFHAVREATEEHEPESQADGDSGPEPHQVWPARKPA
jgi:hypothetical protein